MKKTENKLKRGRDGPFEKPLTFLVEESFQDEILVGVLVDERLDQHDGEVLRLEQTLHRFTFDITVLTNYSAIKVSYPVMENRTKSFCCVMLK